jgi:hypothetical protein
MGTLVELVSKLETSATTETSETLWFTKISGSDDSKYVSMLCKLVKFTDISEVLAS